MLRARVPFSFPAFFRNAANAFDIVHKGDLHELFSKSSFSSWGTNMNILGPWEVYAALDAH